MKKYLLLGALLTVTSACSDSSSDGGSFIPPSTTVTISGKVSDPAVDSARVSLVAQDGSEANFCGANSNTICQTWTNKDGLFTMVVPRSKDLSTYYIKSVGGKDSVYNMDFNDISFVAPLSSFNAGVDGNWKDINVTPVTSLIKALTDNGLSSVEAVKEIATALGLSESDVMSDPETVNELLKQSFLTVKTAKEKGGNNPMADIASALAQYDKGFDDSNVLASIFQNDTAASEEISQTAALLDTLQSDDNLTLAEDIYSAELADMFSDSYIELLGKTAADVSPNALANIKALSDYFKGLSQDKIPLKDFNINQLTLYAATYQDNNGDMPLSLYESFDVDSASFNTVVSGLFADSAAVKNALALISSEDVVPSSIATAEALGNDNQKRIEYYFNSDADKNYVARSLTSRVLNDTINDAIYTNIVKTYAKFNLLDKAKNFAESYIKGSLNRASAYNGISEGASLYDKAKGVEIATKGYDILESIRKGGYSIDSDFVKIYIEFYFLRIDTSINS